LIENNVESLLGLDPSRGIDIVIISPRLVPGIKPLLHGLPEGRKDLIFGGYIGLDLLYGDRGKVPAHWDTSEKEDKQKEKK